MRCRHQTGWSSSWCTGTLEAKGAQAASRAARLQVDTTKQARQGSPAGTNDTQANVECDARERPGVRRCLLEKRANIELGAAASEEKLYSEALTIVSAS